MASTQILQNLIQNLSEPRSGENFSKPQWEPACWIDITPIPIVPQPHFPSLRRSMDSALARAEAQWGLRALLSSGTIPAKQMFLSAPF